MEAIPEAIVDAIVEVIVEVIPESAPEAIIKATPEIFAKIRQAIAEFYFIHLNYS